MKFLAFGIDMNASIKKNSFYIRITLPYCDVWVLYNNGNNDDANDNEIS